MTNKNPWLSLALDHNRKSFLIKEEESIIAKFNTRVSDQYKIHTSIFPAPFMGDVHNASVIILMLNPGFDPKEEQAGYYSIYKDWWLKQIQHLLPCPELPLFCLDDEYVEKSSYWSNKLKPLTDIIGKEIVARKVAKIQYFPYHSREFKPLYKRLLKEEGFESYLASQLYNFNFVKKAMKRNALIIIPRSKKYWFEAIPKLREYSNLYFTKNYRNPILSKNNLGESNFTAILSFLEN